MTSEEIKKNVGFYAVNFVRHGMTIGLGSGTTVHWFIKELGKRIKQGLSIKTVPTSIGTDRLAKEAGIAISDLNEIESLSLTIDGADEIDPNGQLIKGGGGALLREKIVAAASEELIIIADNSKMVQQLGKFPLPVEVVPFGHKQVQQKIISSGLCKAVNLRQKNNQPFTTDHQHYILDCTFEKINDAFALNSVLHLIPGVVETGLFIDMASRAIIGHEDGRIELIKFK
jgi:ribose 5-phosphate isomerase A